jgi:hypothetical protein
MIRTLKLNEQPTIIELFIKTNEREKIWIKVKDSQRENTFYTKRYAFVDGNESFFVNMPQAPDIAKVIVYNDELGLRRRDKSFKVKLRTKPLDINPPPMSKKTRAFVSFAQDFSDECGYLSSSMKGDRYRSNNGKFIIDYFDYITSKSDGSRINTPARISQLTGRIEVSAEAFRKYTIPMRLAILFHEYAHYHLNDMPSSEIEADINGIRIYLGLGYPRIDIFNVFLNVFKRSPNQRNKERYEKLKEFVERYERTIKLLK